MKSKITSILSYLMGIAACLSITFLTGCGDDEAPFVPQPSITFEATGDNISFNDDKTRLSVVSGTVVTWDFDITVPGGFRSFITSGFRENVVIEDEDSIVGDVTISEDRTTVTINKFTNTFTGNDDIEISFVTTDDLGQSDVVKLTVEITSPGVRTKTNITMMAPVQNMPETPEDDRTSSTWFSANLGSTITSAEIVGGSSLSKDVDFGFYYADGKAFLSSPESFPTSQYDLSSTGQNWSTLHITTFRTLEITQSNFFAINTAFDIEEAYSNGEDTNEDGVIDGITGGSLIGFQSDVDKDGGIIRGVMFIRSVTPGTESSPAELSFDVRIQ